LMTMESVLRARQNDEAFGVDGAVGRDGRLVSMRSGPPVAFG
jgi:hypothetical protein